MWQLITPVIKQQSLFIQLLFPDPLDFSDAASKDPAAAVTARREPESMILLEPQSSNQEPHNRPKREAEENIGRVGRKLLALEDTVEGWGILTN